MAFIVLLHHSVRVEDRTATVASQAELLSKKRSTIYISDSQPIHGVLSGINPHSPNCRHPHVGPLCRYLLVGRWLPWRAPASSIGQVSAAGRLAGVASAGHDSPMARFHSKSSRQRDAALASQVGTPFVARARNTLGLWRRRSYRRITRPDIQNRTCNGETGAPRSGT